MLVDNATKMLAQHHRLILITACLAIPTPSTLAAGGGSGGNGRTGAVHVPVTYKLHQKQTECIYDLLLKDDHVTWSAFAVESSSNGPLAISLKFEGPIAPPDDVRSLGEALFAASVNWPKIKDSDVGVRYDKRVGIIGQSLRVDWTHAGEEEDAAAARDRIEMEKREAYRSHYGHPRSGTPADNVEKMKRDDLFRTVVMAEVQPYEDTHIIKAPGWYRLCASADYHALTVEMEIRSGTELGGVDPETKHVYTRAERERLDAETTLDGEVALHDAERGRELDFNTYATLAEEKRKVVENQVRETDLHPTKAQIVHLNDLVAEIKRKQDRHRDRMRNHKAASRRNYESLVRSGKLETLLYALTTVVQLYTVRRWLLSKSLLGSFQQTPTTNESKFH